MNLLIKFFHPDDIMKGNFTLSGKYLQETAKIFPEILSEDFLQPNRGIAVCARKSDGAIRGVLLKIKSMVKFARGIRIYYDIEDSLDATSDEILKLTYIRLLGDGKIKSKQWLPLWCVMDDIQTDFVLRPKSKGTRESMGLKDHIESLKNQKEWFKIYDPFRPAENIRESNPDVWKDPVLLSYIAYAATKLSETPGIPREIKYDLFRKNDYLISKKHLRNDTVFLFNRCIELDPNNPVYKSMLGDFHYKNVFELTSGNGRKDGNIIYEIDKAVKFFNEALSLDSERMDDLYKKGFLLCAMLPNLIYRGHIKITTEEKVSMINKGINALRSLIDIWCNYNEFVRKQYDLKKKYKKEYIKSLYFLGLGYNELVISDFDVIDYYLGINRKLESGLTRIESDNAENALRYFADCWNAESDTNCLPDIALSTCIEKNWTVEGADKLYSLGNANLKLYKIYMDNKMATEAKRCLDEAERFLREALKGINSEVKSYVSTEDVINVLAKALIGLKKREEAAEIIEVRCNRKRIQGNIANTYALSLILLNRLDDALNTLERAAFDISNKFALPAYFLLGMVYIRKGNLEGARSLFKKAIRHKFKNRIDAKELMYIGMGITELKAGNKKDAAMYLKRSVESLKYGIYARNLLQDIKAK